MKSSVEIDVAEYVGDLIYTLIFVFNRVVASEAVIEWLRPMVSTRDQREALLQEEPVYVAADFLGIDRLSSSFRVFEQKYLKFRSYILAASARPITLDDPSLSEFVPGWRSAAEHVRGVGHHQDYMFGSPSKTFPHHVESPANKVRVSRGAVFTRGSRLKQRGFRWQRRHPDVRFEKYGVETVSSNGISR
jgi:hypothetical protein